MAIQLTYLVCSSIPPVLRSLSASWSMASFHAGSADSRRSCCCCGLVRGPVQRSSAAPPAVSTTAACSRRSAGSWGAGLTSNGTAVTSAFVCAPKTSQLSSFPAPVAQPGQIQGRMFKNSITGAHHRLSRQNPVMALSPVARVQRSISRLMKYWVITPSRQAQKKTNPLR